MQTRVPIIHIRRKADNFTIINSMVGNLEGKPQGWSPATVGTQSRAAAGEESLSEREEERQK